MHPKSTRTFTSHILLAMALAAGLSFAPLGEARAQHGGHHGHEGHGAKKPPAAKKKAPARKRGSGAGVHHAGHGASAPDALVVAEYQAAHASMMRGMALPYTGDPDVDFRVQMIPHHQGAIDMARLVLVHGRDPLVRGLAEDIIAAQQAEIQSMAARLRLLESGKPPDADGFPPLSGTRGE